MNGIDPELALRIVRESPIIAYDTETSGLDPTVDFICGYVITNAEHSLYIPVRHEAGGNIPDAVDFELALAGAFSERSRNGLRTVGHNLGFDLRFSLRHGVKLWSPLEDSMINEGLIDDRTIGYGLDDLSARYQVTAKKGDALYRAIANRFGGIPDRKQMQHFWRMPGDDPDVVDYATGDGVSTLEVHARQQVILDREELRVPHTLECDLLPYVARMWQRGMRVDMAYGEIASANLEKQITENKSAFPPGFNSRAPSEVEKLYRANGFSDQSFARTAQGKPSFTEKWLESNDIGRAILDIRRLEKARDSFITPLVSTHNRAGRVHPTLNQSKSDEYGVAGARFSASNPNLHAYPKRNKMVGKIVRPLIVPDEGMELGEGDAMQQEPRFFAHYSEDPGLLDGFINNPNFSMHRRANDLMFGGDEEMYDTAKRMSMGILSMMFPKTLAGHLNCSVEKATKLRNQFLYDTFPAIGKFQNDVMSVFERRGYVRSILGRRARFESSRFAYQGVSRVIQNSGGDHIKTCVLRANQFEDAHPEVQILFTIHDSVIWQNDPARRDLVKELITVLEWVPHEPQFNLKVPIPFEVGLGQNWAITSYGDKAKGKMGWAM